jgi:hypothetical protein
LVDIGAGRGGPAEVCLTLMVKPKGEQGLFFQ